MKGHSAKSKKYAASFVNREAAPFVRKFRSACAPSLIRVRGPRWGRAGTMIRNKTDVAAAICAAAFVVVLAVSAYWDRSIRVLHVFESLPYIAAAILCLRRSKVGYALGAASGASWLWMA